MTIDIPLTLAVLTVTIQLIIVNNKLEALIKTVRENRSFPTIPATGKPITEHEMEEKQ